MPDDSWAVGDLVPAAVPLPAPGASVTSSGRRIWQGLIPGQVVGGYRLHEPLGAGGAGQVWRAVEPASGREVALKVVDPHLGHDARTRLLREGRLTAALRHPGIVRIHAAGEDPAREGLPGAAWLAYELVPGGRTWQDVGPTLAPAERVRALSAVARALGFAHSKGVVHRDVKSTNILVDPSGRPKVADLGLARALAETRLTQTGVLLGTPGAMAPEQLEGRPAGPPADVWALGALLHEALTGRSPFEGARTLLALRAAVRAPRLFEGTPPPGLPPAQRKRVEAIVRRCLDQDAAARYPDGTALADALVEAGLGDAAERSVAYPGVGARPEEPARPGAPRPGTTRASRTSLWLSALPAGLAAVALVVAASALHAGGGTARADAELRRRVAEVRRAGSGPAAAASLEALLAGGAAVFGPPAELQARLALAEATAPASLDGWRARLDHARRAVELAGATGAPGDEGRALAAAERASGRALLMLGRAAEAEAAFGRAHAAGAGPGALADRAAALLAAGRPAQAERLAASLLPRASAAPSEAALAPAPAEVVPTIVRARLALGDLAGARGALWAARAAQDASPGTSGGGMGPLLALLEAEVAATTGADPRPALEAAVRAWPRHAEPALALVRHLGLRLGRLDAAVGVARAFMARAADVRRAPASAPRSGQEEADQLELLALAAAGPALLVVEPGPVSPDVVRLPAPWRRAAARWALGEGRREAALMARRVKAAPRPRPGRGPWGPSVAPPARSLQERGQAGARALARAAALAQASDVHDGEVVARAGAALASLGASLRAPPPPEDPVRRAAAAAMFVDALERRRMGADRDRTIADLRGVLALDPGDALARYEVGMLLFDHPESTIVGLRDLVVALDAEPDLLTPLARSLRTLAAARPFLKGESIDEVVAGLRFVVGDARDRLGEAILRVHLAEYERRPEHGALALDLLDAALEADPGVVFAWVLRGGLHLRAGRLDEAARDLAVAGDAAPTCAMVAFYEGLLRAARGEAPAVVLAALQRASDLDFSAWEDDGWDPSIYPELAPYLALPGFEVVAGGNRGDAREDAPRKDGR